jgi:hypothetical protein
MKIQSPKDFWAGLMFMALGLFFVFAASGLSMGSVTRMGPAYFPTVLGGLMAVLGGVIFFLSLTVKGGKVPPISFRPLFFTTLALIAFGYLLRPLGIVVAVALLVAVSAFAGHGIKLKEVVIISIVLLVFSVLVFVKALGLPFPLWPEFLG